MKIKLTIYLLSILFLYSCQSLKDGLTGKKQDNSDEFLVIKKNPLEIPPEFNKLPVPKKNEAETSIEAIDEEIEDLIKSIKKSEKTSSKDNSVEEFIMKKIKKN